LGLPLFPGFTSAAKAQLLQYRWPGNVRELKNVVERSVYRHGSSSQPLDNIIINPFATRPSTDNQVSNNTDATTDELSPLLPALPVDLKLWLHNSEHQMLKLALEQARFNQRRAAGLLGLTYHQLRGMLKKHAILTNDNDQE
ncbi:MAG: helix-turn-helix domain-containing protein, partial [Yersinia sp. (in: enterobacteria)]